MFVYMYATADDVMFVYCVHADDDSFSICSAVTVPTVQTAM